MKNVPIALVTGSNGFVGFWLVDLLLKKKYRVVGLDYLQSSNISGIEYTQIDILKSQAVSDLINEIQPDYIFHLAAISYLPHADKSPQNALMINIAGSINLFDAVKKHSPKSKLLFVGSSKQYGNISKDKISENDTAEPSNFYAVSKQCGELIGKQYAHDFGLQFYFARSFNHTGPGQSPLFVCSDWASQVAKISLGKMPPLINVGDLNSTVDFLDVRDVVAAYVSIIENGKAGEVYNVCSGEGVDLRWILSYLISKSDIEITIQEDIAKKRSHSTNKLLTGDNSKLKNETGWENQIALGRTLDEVYHFWIKELKFAS
jgi:GDP-4-dehydro-6-deoxy-D-mannose reductase